MQIIKDKSKKNNLLIEGDNLKSLTYLKKDYLEKIDLIYIDPPYNTGSKKFKYKDCFTKEEWKNFITERFLIAYDLLKETGLIFISIDDNELYSLKPICDEIFGNKNFIENFIWVKNNTKNNSKTSSNNHEYILCYSKNKKEVEKLNYFRVKKEGFDDVLDIVKNNKISKTPKEIELILKDFYKKNSNLKGISCYKFVDSNYKVYSSGDLSSPQEGYVYDIIHPVTKKVCKCPKNGWRYKESELNKLLKEDKILFGEDENKVPRFKRFLDDVEDEVLKSVINNNFDGKKELIEIFNDKCPFDNPKPSKLIKLLIETIHNKDAIILDFFAGSGTTGQAVMELNKEDGGNRQFILCTNNENNICKEITFVRLNTLITGIRKDKSIYGKGFNENLDYFEIK